jgi:hypothetical protein
MDDLKFGLGFIALLCSAGWIIGGISALIPCIVFCAIPIVSEIRERQKSEHLEFETCQLCGSQFRIRNKTMEWEYRTIGLCPLCLDSIFQYSRTIPEKPAK